MKFYLNRMPRILMSLYSKYTWRFSSDKKEIYLTFDDGPTPQITDFVLSELKKFNAKATFFCIGKNVVQHPKIYQRILNENHTVGNHTHNHFNGFKHNTKKYVENCVLASQHIDSKLFRPPYGRIKSSQAKALQKLGYNIVMWHVISGDFDPKIKKEECLKTVLKNTKNGSIIVFHDSIKASNNMQYVLPKVLEEFSKQGYTFKAIQQKE